MAAKKTALTDAERAKRIREAAREHETDNDPASFERTFADVTRGVHKPKKPEPDRKQRISRLSWATLRAASDQLLPTGQVRR
jgi:hypothetical protein